MGNNIQQHYLYPSTLFASKDEKVILTVLGSCVSVCLWDSALHYGGMNHYMLPLWNGDGLASPKYGNIANEKLLNKMLSYGSDIRNIKAKIFGGGEVIETQIKMFNIGERNALIALDFLKENNISVIAKSLGGKHGRKILFNTSTGEVLHRFIQKSV
jgi:chemotaxis protein CheD